MAIEKYSCYEFEIKMAVIMRDLATLGYFYQIYDPHYKPCEQTVIEESAEWFETEQEARFAAIGHIDLLENGEG